MLLVDHIDIYDYTDYRAYLKRCYDDLKKENANFSYRLFSQAVGFTSDNYMKLIIDGSRNLTATNIQKVIQALGLRGKRKEYFENLINWNQAKDSLNQELFYQKLVAIAKREPVRRAMLSKEGLYSKWYYVVVRELVTLIDFIPDPQWVAKKLGGKLTAADASDAINFLLQKSFIQDTGSRYIQSVPKIKSEDETAIHDIRQFHRKMMMLAMEELSRSPVQEREVCCITMPTNPEGFQLLKQRIKEFLVDISESNDPTNAREIAQFNIQLFKLTKGNQS